MFSTDTKCFLWAPKHHGRVLIECFTKRFKAPTAQNWSLRGRLQQNLVAYQHWNIARCSRMDRVLKKIAKQIKELSFLCYGSCSGYASFCDMATRQEQQGIGPKLSSAGRLERLPLACISEILLAQAPESVTLLNPAPSLLLRPHSLSRFRSHCSHSLLLCSRFHVTAFCHVSVVL